MKICEFHLSFRINNIPVMFQVMACRRPGEKPLSELMAVSILTHICVTRPQWVESIMAQRKEKFSRHQSMQIKLLLCSHHVVLNMFITDPFYWQGWVDSWVWVNYQICFMCDEITHSCLSMSLLFIFIIGMCNYKPHQILRGLVFKLTRRSSN